MLNFPIDYFFYVSISSVSVIQLAAMKAKLNKILIINNKYITFVVSISLIILSAISFMVSDNRIINDFEGGLDANQQFLIFLSGCLTSFLFTVVVTSIYRKSEPNNHTCTNLSGLNELSQHNFLKLQFSKWNHFTK